MKLFSAVSLCAALILSQATRADEATRDISFNGFGELSVAPDRATLSFAVEARNPSLNQARNHVSSVITQTLAIADSLGIDRKFVVSSHSSIRPEYTRHHKTNERAFSGYLVNRQVTVNLQDIELLGVVTERLLDAGINNVSSPQFSHSQEQQLRRKALAAAAVDARNNATAIASALGNQIGETLSINSNVHASTPIQPRMKMAATSFASGAPSESYSAGQIVINATVSARFELK